MRFAISGASSFIGRRLLAEVLRSGKHEVVAIVQNVERAHQLSQLFPSAEVLVCNMQSYGTLGDMVGTADCFIGLAWSNTRGQARQDEMLQREGHEANIAAVSSLLDAGCHTIVTSGSQAEYGFQDGIITEDAACNPTSAYGKSKLAFFREALRECEASGARLIEPRYFSLYGPGDYNGTLVMSVASKLLDGKPCLLNDCDQWWDYLYVDDAVRGLLMLCESPDAEGVYNFASGESRPLREYVLEMRSALNSKSAVVFDSSKAPFKGEQGNLRPSVKKLDGAIPSWRPLVPFSAGVKAVADSMGRKGPQ